MLFSKKYFLIKLFSKKFNKMESKAQWINFINIIDTLQIENCKTDKLKEIIINSSDLFQQNNKNAINNVMNEMNKVFGFGFYSNLDEYELYKCIYERKNYDYLLKLNIVVNDVGWNRFYKHYAYKTLQKIVKDKGNMNLPDIIIGYLGLKRLD